MLLRNVLSQFFRVKCRFFFDINQTKRFLNPFRSCTCSPCHHCRCPLPDSHHCHPHYIHEFNLTSTFFAGFCLFYAVHGVLREREFELYAYIVGILVLLFYIIIDLIVNNNRPTLKWVSTV